MTLILGIDPGLRKTGWGIITKKNSSLYYIASGVIKSVDSVENLQQTLNIIYENICEIIKKYKPEYCAIENTYVNSNAISSLKLSQARAVALLACYRKCGIVAEYQASTVKKIITGKGNADKIQVDKMMQIQLNLQNIVFKTADESDALAIAMCHAINMNKNY